MTGKNYLLINTKNNIWPLVDFLTELNMQDFNFLLLSHDNKLLTKFRELKWPGKRLFILLNNNKLKLLYIILSPLIYFAIFWLIWLIKVKKNINQIICFDSWEITWFAPIAKLLRLRLILIQCPGDDCNGREKFLSWWTTLHAKQLPIIAFNTQTKKVLQEFGFNYNEINFIPFASKQHNLHQTNLFTSLAEADKAKTNKKFFSIATVVDLRSEQKVETLLRSAKQCLTVIPDLQLIIIGDGVAKKNMEWLAKKLQINNLVWFVGEQVYLHKWFNNLDIYIASCDCATLTDISATLSAAANSLPIICPGDIGLNDYISHTKTGIIIKPDDSEDLTQAIIKLYKEKYLRKQLGQNAKRHIEEHFNIEKTTNLLMQILN